MKRAHGPYRHGHKWRIIIRSEDRSQRNRREPQDKPEGVLMVYRVTHRVLDLSYELPCIRRTNG